MSVVLASCPTAGLDVQGRLTAGGHSALASEAQRGQALVTPPGQVPELSEATVRPGCLLSLPCVLTHLRIRVWAEEAAQRAWEELIDDWWLVKVVEAKEEAAG